MPWCRTSTLFLAIRRPCCSIEGIDRLNQANEPRLTRRCREILNDETSSAKMSPFPRQAKGWKPGITYAALTVFSQFPIIAGQRSLLSSDFAAALMLHACSSSLTDGTLLWVWFHNSKPIMEMGNVLCGLLQPCVYSFCRSDSACFFHFHFLFFFKRQL